MKRYHATSSPERPMPQGCISRPTIPPKDGMKGPHSSTLHASSRLSKNKMLSGGTANDDRPAKYVSIAQPTPLSRTQKKKIASEILTGPAIATTIRIED